ncbi:helix-turn-helix domain-containing protein [Brenneria izadpanahii]|uniref:Helix-turn-helix domain-containing protein n=1 Tax=Brenneria izadpanahii TaxID=2722756 RepID=A0ABX7UWY8_9GAMM|nr:helix-turn-helix transcriptional regulator [Brenneria izadpanahii]QTF08675.1 helix-turn-helix domain-containing protein [Brenneria izadpanahii]
MKSSARENARRHEFGSFLKSRRERLRPADVGLPDGARRRTPGLRRDEVALLAGIGITWYTWLEQGRDVRPSYEVLSSIAATLKLDEAERRYLFDLAGQPLRKVYRPKPQPPGEAMLRMLQRAVNQPAYILGPRWDVVAWNHAASALFGDYSKLHGDERNIMYMMFNNPAHRRLLTDWRDLAPTVVGMFRAENAPLTGDADYDRLVATLLRESQDFRYWWQRHDVIRYTSINKRINHPEVGAMVFEYNSFSSDDGRNMKLVVYTPLEENNTVEKMQRLIGGWERLAGNNG